jgi:hypothetical protein
MKTGNEVSNTEFDIFSSPVFRVLSVSRTKILRRASEYEKQAALNPKP